MNDVSNAELARCLERVESKLDRLGDDHEQRLRRAERALYVALGLALAGAGTGVGSMLSTVVGG